MATNAKAPGRHVQPGRDVVDDRRRTGCRNTREINRIGARVPPEVPEPSAIHHASSLPTSSTASVPTASRPARTSLICRSRRRARRGTTSPTRPKPSAADHRVPERGHRQAAEAGLDEEEALADDHREQAARDAEDGEDGKRREAESSRGAATCEQRPGSEQRRVHARRRRSTPTTRGRTRGARIRRAATRSRARPRRAARRRLPPCRPPRRTASRILRSDGDTGITCPMSEPNAPPVTMIGPSAPNGPPVPMATAADSGLATATRGAIRLCADEHRLHRFGDAVPLDHRRPLAPGATTTSAPSGGHDQEERARGWKSRRRAASSPNGRKAPRCVMRADELQQQPCRAAADDPDGRRQCREEHDAPQLGTGARRRNRSAFPSCSDHIVTTI